MKLMRHPSHGWHHAYTVAEEAAMRLHGWVDDAPIEQEPQAEVAPRNTLKLKKDQAK